MQLTSIAHSTRCTRLTAFCRLLGLLAIACWFSGQRLVRADDGLELFERKIRPVLIEHCYSCHSAEAKEVQGGLRLDLRAGWQLGGDSGQPAIVPGAPESSPLIQSIQHAESASEMPPQKDKLADSVIADFVAWVKLGSPDPRDGSVAKVDKLAEWEAQYTSRLDWWSLKPISPPTVPEVRDNTWPSGDVDRFILSKIESGGLQPLQAADRPTLARRLSYALTGLPPDPHLVEDFSSDESPQAYENLVDQLLASPSFGEHWGRHWMDVVHYADTHGYEWDVPAKNAWMYRDYLTRAFNGDVPYRQLVLEQIAGDLIVPRIDPACGLNESLIGPMMLRLGERRHGDNSAIEGVTQEAVANMIDTLGKAFLGTTLACAQCHNHKLDAVEQRDYYALAGMLMSTRYSARPVDSVDAVARNQEIIEQLAAVKQQLRSELGHLWLEATDPDLPEGALAKLKAIPAEEKPLEKLPTSLVEFWKRSLAKPVNEAEFMQERQARIEANRQNLTLLADFSRSGDPGDWRWDGQGMHYGLVDGGEIVIYDEGDAVIEQVLPAGRFSHVWSQRLAGSLQSPKLESAEPVTFSIEIAAGKFASQSFIVDRALNPERLAFPNSPTVSWQTLTAGNFDSLEGTPDKALRRVYFELATKSLNNYFPARVGYGGVSESEVADPRSWFGATRVYRHAPGKGPQDELGRFAALFEELKDESDWSKRLVQLLRAAVKRWADHQCNSEDVRLINEALQLKLLPNNTSASAEVGRLVAERRALEKQLQPDRTVGSAADWQEGRDERIGIRGSYIDLGEQVPRAGVRLLGQSNGCDSSTSGRLEWASQIVDPRNPLTARVYVNRIWHYLFGEGLVRTPDDFGHLGDLPAHAELLDHLATRFIEHDWSTKWLIRELVTSSTWRQASVPNELAVQADPENRLWHHMPMRRLEAEAIRDSILAVSGRLDRAQFGPPIEPHRTAEDSQKRLFKGPLDGDGRRSLYTEMTLMEMPRFLALFNQPLPKQTVGRRDVTNVPDQALALLNDPLVVAMAEQWSRAQANDGSSSAEERAARMLHTALARKPRSEEVARLIELVRQSAELRGATGDLLACQPAWQDAAHAIFNLKEFLYVR